MKLVIEEWLKRQKLASSSIFKIEICIILVISFLLSFFFPTVLISLESLSPYPCCIFYWYTVLKLSLRVSSVKPIYSTPFRLVLAYFFLGLDLFTFIICLVTQDKTRHQISLACSVALSAYGEVNYTES
jgi:hypothetical protein